MAALKRIAFVGSGNWGSAMHVGEKLPENVFAEADLEKSVKRKSETNSI